MTRPHLWKQIQKAIIPISVPIAYDALYEAAIKGKKLDRSIACPKCGAIGQLVYTSTKVDRGSNWLGRKGVEARATPVPLACCGKCKARIRVLPLEIPPYKTFTLSVIEAGCLAYVDSCLPKISLNGVVISMGGDHPHRSTLHGWLGGLGERVLGRLDQQKAATSPVAVSALIAETNQRLRVGIFELWRESAQIACGKYRSEKRREQLEACGRLFHTARKIFPKPLYPFTAWENWLQNRFHVAAWTFPARFSCTDFQHHGRGGCVVESAASPEKTKKQRKKKYHGARSPPGSLLEI